MSWLRLQSTTEKPSSNTHQINSQRWDLPKQDLKYLFKHTSNQSIEVEHSNVQSVITKQNGKEVFRNTSNQFIKVKYFHVQTVNTKREPNSLLGDIWSQFIKCSIVTNNNRAGQINLRNAPETPEYASQCTLVQWAWSPCLVWCWWAQHAPGAPHAECQTCGK